MLHDSVVIFQQGESRMRKQQQFLCTGMLCGGGDDDAIVEPEKTIRRRNKYEVSKVSKKS